MMWRAVSDEYPPVGELVLVHGDDFALATWGHDVANPGQLTWWDEGADERLEGVEWWARLVEPPSCLEDQGAPERIWSVWQEFQLSHRQVLTEARRKTLRARVRDAGVENACLVIQWIFESDDAYAAFLRSRGYTKFENVFRASSYARKLEAAMEWRIKLERQDGDEGVSLPAHARMVQADEL